MNCFLNFIRNAIIQNIKKSLQDALTKAVADNRRRRVLLERQNRARALANERSQQRQHRQRNRRSLNASKEDSEGVMDSLLEQLKSGAAFSTGRKGEGTRGGQVRLARYRKTFMCLRFKLRKKI